MSAVIDSDHAHDDHGSYGGIMRWVNTTNHKDIGTLYLWFSFTMFLVGGVLALAIRAELFRPGLQFWHPEFFNQLTTMHGLIMVFGAIMPAFVGFANWQVPLMIGAPDMAFARMNNWSFWLLPVAATLLVGSFFVPGGATAAGWTIYAPLSTQMGPGMDLAIFALHIMGASSIMGSINIITTILNMRAPGMTMMRIPLFVWTWLITAYLLIAVMPVLAGAITMLLTDRHFGTSFFNAAGGGDPVMFQHIVWVFGHPAGFIFVFSMRGFAGLILGIMPIDVQLQDTYYVVAHFHYVLVAGSLFSLFAGFYFWVPKWTGRMYDETLGKWHFWLSMIFFNVTFFPMHFLGLAGMPRRIPDYALQFAEFNEIASIGAFGFALSQILFLWIILKVTVLGRGEKAGQRPWDGADTLEWTHLPSPAPYHSFHEQPVVG